MGIDIIHDESRRFRFAVLCVIVLFVGLAVLPAWQPVMAQEDSSGDKSTTTTHEQPNLFMHIVKSAGPVFGPLLLFTSIALVTLIVLLALDLRMAISIPPQFVEEFAETVNKRRFKEAFDLAKGEHSFVGQVLTSGMSRLQYGIEDAREAALNTVESVKAGKEQYITYLATIGTLGPMLGLVGTVFGMILSFMVLAVPGSTPKPDELAKGISHALVVTLLGIGLSVPAIFCHAFFRNRLIRISIDTSNIADDLLTQMYHNSRKPAPTDSRPAGAEARASTGNLKLPPTAAPIPVAEPRGGGPKAQ